VLIKYTKCFFMDKLPKHLKHIKTEHKARTGPQHSSRDNVII